MLARSSASSFAGIARAALRMGPVVVALSSNRQSSGATARPAGWPIAIDFADTCSLQPTMRTQAVKGVYAHHDAGSAYQLLPFDLESGKTQNVASYKAKVALN